MQAAGEASNSVTQQVSEATSAAVQSVQDASGNLLDSFNQAVPGLQSSVESTTTSLFSQVLHQVLLLATGVPQCDSAPMLLLRPYTHLNINKPGLVWTC